MRIISLSPVLTDLIVSFGAGASLVGVTGRCSLSETILGVALVTTSPSSPLLVNKLELTELPGLELLPDVIRQSAPDLIVAMIDNADEPNVVSAVAQRLSSQLGFEVKLRGYDPRSLDGVYAFFEGLGKDCGVPGKGLVLAQRMKAQFMDWADNMYDRMKNKRVTLMSSIGSGSPGKAGEALPTLAGRWIPDMIKLCSCVSQAAPGLAEHVTVRWDDILQFRPDVIIVAPQHMALSESLRLFKTMERFPHWEEIPAVKRGEVSFCDGVEHFYRPTARLMDSMGILVSAIAGFDSGYITPRESFYRLRWLELQRHRFV